MNAIYDGYLCHHGVLGMKWGVRRYQNKDGSLTAEGKKHVSNYKKYQQYNDQVQKEADKLIKKDKRLSRDFGNSAKNIDDYDLFDLMIQEYAINGEAYYKANKQSIDFHKNNYDSIAKGRKIVKKMKNKYPNSSSNYRNKTVTIVDPEGYETKWKVTNLSDDQIRQAKKAGYKITI